MVFGIMEVRATSTMNSQHPAGSEFPSGLPSLSQQAQDRPSGQPLFPAADRQLLQDCLQGRPAAWEAFFERFVGLLAFVVDRTAVQRRIVLDRADRDDLLADILLERAHAVPCVETGRTGRYWRIAPALLARGGQMVELTMLRLASPALLLVCCVSKMS
jgi:hypothetical protein